MGFNIYRVLLAVFVMVSIVWLVADIEHSSGDSYSVDTTLDQNSDGLTFLMECDVNHKLEYVPSGDCEVAVKGILETKEHNIERLKEYGVGANKTDSTYTDIAKVLLLILAFVAGFYILMKK
jgi:hypothetical protein